MFEEGLGSAYRSHSNDSKRDRREAESERLVNVAKENGLYIPKKETESLGEKIQKHSGESIVYINTNTERVYKIKAPYAKSALKSGVQPEDVIYEFQVHNAIFPETEYTLEGISDEYGDVRIVLSQHLVSSKNRPTKEQIAEDLAKRGFKPEGKYSFGDKYISITDVEGDNVLLGEDGRLYYIDPIINYKKPVKEILEWVNSALTTLPLADTKCSLRGNSQEVADIVAKAKADGTYSSENDDIRYSLRNQDARKVATDATITSLEGSGIEVVRVSDALAGAVMRMAKPGVELSAKKEHLKPHYWKMNLLSKALSFQMLMLQRY